MPKIRITEKDNTGVAIEKSIPNIVYIPGAASKAVAPELFSDLESFNKATSYIDDGSYKLAKRLLALGMQVLYEGFVLQGEGQKRDVTLRTPIRTDEEMHSIFEINDIVFTIQDNVISYSYGDQNTNAEDVEIVDGVATLTEGFEDPVALAIDFVDKQVQYTMKQLVSGSIVIPEDSWTRLQDKSAFDVRFLTTGAYADQSSLQNMVACATARGDCTALVDHSASAKTVADVRNAFSSVGDSEYAAGFTPWCTININNEDVHLPGSSAYLLAYARSVQTNPSWFAVAGSFRGVVPGLKSVDVKYSSAEIEMLQARATDHAVELDDQADNVGFAINPIAYQRPFGIVIWGNRTLLNNNGSTKATSFLNVRNLISEIKKAMYNAAKTYTFEQNSDVLWINFKSLITPLLDRMKSSSGINDYSIARLKTNAKARLKARISIVPIEAVEDFDLEVYLEDSIPEVSE